jgi:hypothetical protein
MDSTQKKRKISCIRNPPAIEEKKDGQPAKYWGRSMMMMPPLMTGQSLSNLTEESFETRADALDAAHRHASALLLGFIPPVFAPKDDDFKGLNGEEALAVVCKAWKACGAGTLCTFISTLELKDNVMKETPVSSVPYT